MLRIPRPQAGLSLRASAPIIDGNGVSGSSIALARISAGRGAWCGLRHRVTCQSEVSADRISGYCRGILE